MFARLSWAWVRNGVVLIGTPFVAVWLTSACLDYAGEEQPQGCDSETAEAGPTGSGVGSGEAAGSVSGAAAEDRPDCGAAAPAPGSGSGSGS